MSRDDLSDASGLKRHGSDASTRARLATSSSTMIERVRRSSWRCASSRASLVACCAASSGWRPAAAGGA